MDPVLQRLAAGHLCQYDTAKNEDMQVSEALKTEHVDISMVKK